MSIIHANENEFDNIVNDDLVLVDFFATWCGPCKMLGPVLENISESRSDMKIVKVDIDENRNLTKKFGVMSVPTLILFKNGEVVSHTTGYMSEDELTSWINEKK